MDIKLYEIANNMALLDDMLDNDNLDEQTYLDTLESLEYMLSTKTNSILKYIRSLETRSDAIKSEIERLKKLKESNDRKISNIEKYVIYVMEKLNVKKVEMDIGQFSLRKTPESVEIGSGIIVPDSYLKTKTTFEPDKTLLKEAIKSGIVIPGICLVTRNTLQIK